MHANGQCLADFGAAQTMLARSGRVHFHHLPPSFCRFDGECLQEGTPARIVDLFGKHAFGHAADAEFFHGDELVITHDLSRQLVQEISPLIGNMLVDSLEFTDRVAPSVRPLDATGHLALRPAQALLSAGVPARIGYQFSGAEGGEVIQAHVDSDIGIYLW